MQPEFLLPFVVEFDRAGQEKLVAAAALYRYGHIREVERAMPLWLATSLP